MEVILVSIKRRHPISLEYSLADEILETSSPDVWVVVERGEIVRVGFCNRLPATHTKRDGVLCRQFLDLCKRVEPFSFSNGGGNVRDGALAKLRIRLECVYHVRLLEVDLGVVHPEEVLSQDPYSAWLACEVYVTECVIYLVDLG